MPPSPSLRRSPVRELRMESSHKRGHSFENRFPPKAKDDDLVLFNEMQNRERDNFLLHPSDDFDDSISKLRYISDFKLNIPAHGESSDLLNADGEKNDYDWLLTPPDTPLFPSLDDDEPRPVNVSRGRARSQPISISRTSMCEKTPRTNRSSASPRRSSPSPGSSYNVVHSRTRPSSAPRSSPPHVLRPTTPSRRPSTPPAKPSSPAQRSLTPTLRRMSTGSSGQAFASKRGTSPIKVNRGSSASPKLRGWQSSLHDFSTDAPPNLRTSLTDRPASHVRGSPPASGNGRNCVSKFGRQSISPSSSRSARSSHNSEGDHFTSICKPSAASSCEDDVESHASMGVSPNAATRKYRDFANTRAMGFSKKNSRSPSSCSAPKRSFDSALRQMDHHKTPQNMFRPLLSSVPATTFYVGKANSTHRPMFSRNSSHTNSSYASSELGASVAPYLEDGDHDQSEWEKKKDAGFQDEVFMFDKLDEIGEDTVNDTCAANLQSSNEFFDGCVTNKDGSILKCSTGDGNAVNTTIACPGSSCAAECSEIVSAEKMSICSKCGRKFMVIYKDMDVDVCQECSDAYELIESEEPGTIQVPMRDEGNYKMGHKVQSQMGMSAHSDSKNELGPRQHERSSEQAVTNFPADSGLYLLVSDKREEIPSKGEVFVPGELSAPRSSDKYEYQQNLPKQEVFVPSQLNAPESSDNCESPQAQPTPSISDKVDNSEGTGIAVLLAHRSSSRKWPVMQGKNFSAANIPFSEPSYKRDNMTAMKRSFGRDSSSASSSIDLGSSGQLDGRIGRQLSSRKGEMENVRGESHTSAWGCGSHSDTNSTVTETLVHPQNESKEVSCSFVKVIENDAVVEILVDAREPSNSFGDADLNALEHISTEQAVTDVDSNALDHTSIEQTVVDIDVSNYTGASLASNDLLMQSKEEPGLQLHDTTVSNNLGESCDLCENTTQVLFNNSKSNIEDIEAPVATTDSCSIEDNYMLNDTGHQNGFSGVATDSPSAMISEQQNDKFTLQDEQDDCTPAQVPNSVENFQEGCISTTSDKDVLLSELESISKDPSNEEQVMTVEAPRKQMQRSFTLEEATDTILFCSSIIHDMAYKAATIAIEKELALYESSHQAVTFVGSSVSNWKDLRNISNKYIQNSHKVRRKKPETAEKMPLTEVGNNVRNSEIPSCNAEAPQVVDSVKPPKLESKCNCTVM
ncbi:unnamed protein product [Musa acuminata subsp. burmannicoides]